MSSKYNAHCLIVFALFSLLVSVHLACTEPGGSYSVDPNWPQLPKGVALGQATGIAVDSHNHVFIFHRANREWVTPYLQFPVEKIQEHTIFMFDGDTGKLKSTWGGNQFIMPHGLSVDPDDNVWVTDVGSQQIHKFSHDGVLLLSIGESGVQGADKSHFALPTDLSFIEDGSVYVSDGYVNTRVIKYTSSGIFDFQWGSPGTQPGNFDLPHGIAASNNRIYVADRSNSRLQIFDHKGGFISEWKRERVGRPFGVAVTSSDAEVFVIDGGDQPDSTRTRVVVLNANGRVLQSFNTEDDADEKNLGHDIAIGDGAVYVVDTWARSVRKYTKHD